MTRAMRRLISCLLGALCVTAGAAASAQDAVGIGILDDKDAERAEAGTLQAEAQLFEIIRQGIAVSIARCEGTPGCTPGVSREELNRIVGKLETRLDTLTARHSESGDAALEPVLLAYVETRDGYTQFLEKLASVLPPENEYGEPVDLGDLPDEFDIFADADAGLADDLDEVPAEDSPAPTE